MTTDSFEIQGGAFNWSSGTLNLTSSAGLTIGQNQFFDSSLALNASQNLGVTNTLTIDPAATLFTDGNLSIGSLMNNGDLILASSVVDGPVSSPAGSSVTVLGDVTFNDLVSGAGGFFGPGTAIFNGGHNPGDSPAVVFVEGSLAYGASNMLTIELEGLLTGQFDRLEVQGDVFLGGGLAVDLLSDFTLGLGDEFEIFNVGGTLSGQFAGLDDGALFSATGGELFRINYGTGNVILTAVPEPSSSVLFVSVLSILGNRRRCSQYLINK